MVCLCFNNSILLTPLTCTSFYAGHRILELKNADRVLQEAGILGWLVAFFLPLSPLENCLKCEGKKRRYTGYTYVFHIPWEEIIFSLETFFLSFSAWKIHKRLQVKWYLTAQWSPCATVHEKGAIPFQCREFFSSKLREI